jgi:hypothetical protein
MSGHQRTWHRHIQDCDRQSGAQVRSNVCLTSCKPRGHSLLERGRPRHACESFKSPPACRPQAPHIVQQPQGAELQAGQPFTLSLSAEGSQPLSYRWQCSGRLLPDETTAELRVQVSLK